ncbi:MAG: hypothetical protein OXL37_17890 [Chloroflexota bacterium]|nr:hypothetical protein [Chloroflexota bacterium]MDE2958842.1 hypothetical protein [Chloroflexota bacterium]
MRELNLQEYQPSGPYRLSANDRDALAQVAKVNIAPAAGEDSAYILTPGSTIGAVETGDLSVLIEPKIGIPQVLSLACYAIGKVKFQPEDFGFQEECALPDALAIALTSHARRAFARGLLHGYRTEEEALYTVRGRIRFDEQLRRRFAVPLPVEVRYDELTVDVLANRLVKAAAYRLGRARLRSTPARRNLSWLASMLEDVSLEEFPASDVPAVRYDRLNEHYRGVVELSRLILRHGEFETGRGAVQASGFLMDMNVVFQEFVTEALRDALGISSRVFGEKSIPSLDHEGCIHLRPDLTWQDGSRYVFVGDAKYKRIADDRIPNADLYQLLAYVTALDLPGGLLIYAKDEGEPRKYHVRHAGKRLEVAALDLSGTLDDALDRVDELANKVLALRYKARGTESVLVPA